jgi:hypothetical protein
MLHFLGVGAQKSGTTWLFQQLSAHPQVRFPRQKELHFWDREDASDIAWYCSQFPPCSAPNVRIGEITPAYAMLSRERIEQIRSEFPALRLFYILRNPIDRAWSSALMALDRAEMTIEEASDQWFIDHFHSQGSMRRGDYEACIRNWQSVYPREQLLVLRYETIAKNPRALLERVAGHLDIDAGFFAALPDSEVGRRVFAGSGHPLRPSLRPVLQKLYSEKIESLGCYLNADFSAWLRAAPGAPD